uniref:disease resistance protein Roq1-like n=1 Tax=Erigeron canadensis TaxID=72917 RepID=UPI001CB97830|nr:disease resistance protein Roq1-like [Erigeron canadensis]
MAHHHSTNARLKEGERERTPTKTRPCLLRLRRAARRTPADGAISTGLSFQVEDTQAKIFVDNLYDALYQAGIHAFKDDEKFLRGKPISQELVKAIEESRFAVTVFSKNYANSSSYLEELAKIIECRDLRRQGVLPSVL